MRVSAIGAPTLNIVAPVGAAVTLNGLTLTGATGVVGAPDFEIYRDPAFTGDVNVDSDEPAFVSYTTVDSARTTAVYFSGVPNTAAVDDVVQTAFDTPVTVAVPTASAASV